MTKVVTSWIKKRSLLKRWFCRQQSSKYQLKPVLQRHSVVLMSLFKSNQLNSLWTNKVWWTGCKKMASSTSSLQSSRLKQTLKTTMFRLSYFVRWRLLITFWNLSMRLSPQKNSNMFQDRYWTWKSRIRKIKSDKRENKLESQKP